MAARVFARIEIEMDPGQEELFCFEHAPARAQPWPRKDLTEAVRAYLAGQLQATRLALYGTITIK